jgi:hypothetical protein
MLKVNNSDKNVTKTNVDTEVLSIDSSTNSIIQKDDENCVKKSNMYGDVASDKNDYDAFGLPLLPSDKKKHEERARIEAEGKRKRTLSAIRYRERNRQILDEKKKKDEEEERKKRKQMMDFSNREEVNQNYRMMIEQINKNEKEKHEEITKLIKETMDLQVTK